MTTHHIPISKINQNNPKALKESNLKHRRINNPPTRNIPIHHNSLLLTRKHLARDRFESCPPNNRVNGQSSKPPKQGREPNHIVQIQDQYQ